MIRSWPFRFRVPSCLFLCVDYILTCSFFPSLFFFCLSLLPSLSLSFSFSFSLSLSLSLSLSAQKVSDTFCHPDDTLNAFACSEIQQWHLMCRNGLIMSSKFPPRGLPYPFASDEVKFKNDAKWRYCGYYTGHIGIIGTVSWHRDSFRALYFILYNSVEFIGNNNLCFI